MPTIRPTDITFGRDDLVAGQLTVNYDAITSIRFEYIIRKHYPHMVTLHHLQFEIFVKNNPTPIKIGKSLLGGFGVSEVQDRTGVNIYEELSRRTFDVRMARYSAQMGESGGFFTMASSS
jgi:hypothetical protein